MSYGKSDPAVAGHAIHVEEARANPDATVPPKQGKRLLGGSPAPGDTLHRKDPELDPHNQERFFIQINP